MSIELMHIPEPYAPNCYAIVGDSIDELIDECMRRIRPQSQGFYRKELRRDLERWGKSLVDCHAGNGVHYTVYMTGYVDVLKWPHLEG